MPTAHVVSYPYDKLGAMPNKELLGLWQTIQESMRSCCALHSDDEERGAAAQEAWDNWCEHVLGEAERRGLPTAMVREPFVCSDCDEPLEAVSADRGPKMFAVCRQCNSHREYGDHLDCRLGPVMPGLPVL